VCTVPYHVPHPTHIVQVVVEVHGASTQVTPQQCGMCGKDGCHRQAPSTRKTEPDACQPLMEVGNHMWLVLTLGQELWSNRDRVTVSSHVPCTESAAPTWTGKQGRGSITTTAHCRQQFPQTNNRSQTHQLASPAKTDGICTVVCLFCQIF
jgi:hypothetical protein